MYTPESDIERFKIQLYTKMSEALFRSSKNMCYTIASEVQHFVHSIDDQDFELKRIANDIVVIFLDDLENKLFNFIETYDKELIDVN